MRAICAAGAIPSLVRLLDKDPVPLACQSALILSKMTGYWVSCKAIRAEALGPLIHLLCREIGNDVLKTVAHTISQSVQSQLLSGFDLYVDIPRDTLQQLVGLLGHGRMEVRLAAAEIISDISRSWSCRPLLKESSTVLDLCHLMLDCRDLSEQELVAAAINALRESEPFDSEVNEIINRKILPPLIRLLDDTCTDTAISACRVLRKPMILEDKDGDNDAILQRLTPLLSHADDEIFVEAAWTALALTWHDPSCPLQNSFTLNTMQRLVRLLRHREERLVVSALRSIADARCLRDLWTDFLLEMVDEGGVRHLVDLLKSRNLAVVKATLLVIHRIQEVAWDTCDVWFSVARHFLKHGIIESLLHALASVSCRFPRTLDIMSFFFSWRTTQFAIPHLVRCLLSLDRPSRELALSSTVDEIIYCDYYVTPAPLDPSIPRHLLRLAWHTLDSRESPRHITIIICWFIDQYSQSREEFRAAGAASFLEDSRLSSSLSPDDRSTIRTLLRLLGQDVDTETDSDSSD